jgi:SAM-dependent methyltransferase
LNDSARTCPACHSADHELLELIDVRDQHRLYAPTDVNAQEQLNVAAEVSGLDYQMLRCRQCELEFCDPMKAPDSNWYALAYQVLDLYPQERWEFSFIASELSENDRLLELGCGSGAFLECCRDRNIPAFGLDFSPNAIEQCRNKGLEAATLSIGQADPSSLPFVPTAIVAFHVLEHLDEPAALFKMARQLASPKTQLWISIPSAKRPTRFFREFDFLDAPPHHMTRWSESALRAAAAQQGWTLREMHYEPISIRVAAWYFATRTKAYRRAAGHKSAGRWERAIRWSLYPAAITSYLSKRNQISGFTMAARFTPS